MKAGLSLPSTGELALPGVITSYAVMAERLGFDSVWVGDHVVFPAGYASTYPYSPGWSGPSSDTPMLDPVATLAFVAAATERVRLGTSVMLLPLRSPVLQAKAIATLDVLSGGRTIFGAGVGWLEAEFQAVGVPFEDRGARADEYLEVLRLLWKGDEVSFDGKYCSLPRCIERPLPVQRPHPPIWIGGNSLAAQRRAARAGDGWIAAFASPEAIAPLIERLSRLIADAGREDAEFTAAAMVDMTLPGESAEARGERIARFAEVGVQCLIGRPRRVSPDADRDEIVEFVERIGLYSLSS